MTESRVAFLHKIISSLPQSENNESLKRMRSFYLMRCHGITSQYGLPIKHFSSKTRCSHCCLEWNKKTEVTIKSIKLSSKQRRKIKAKKITVSNENEQNVQKSLLENKQMEQTCSFCKQKTVTTVTKPDKEYPKNVKASHPISKTTSKRKITELVTTTTADTAKKSEHNKKQKKSNNISNTNVYSNAIDVFSLKNTLASTVKEAPKVIKNNKKKKDKFAGLCQKAVLASAKVKPNKGLDKIQNKLNLFLKPSSG